MKEYISTLKKDKAYQNWKESFYSYVHSRDRVSQPVNYYLCYDVDSGSFMIKSEYSITYNMLALLKCIVPSKKDKKDIVIEEYKYA